MRALRLNPTLALCAGLLIGAGGAGLVLFDRTGRGALEAVLARLGRRSEPRSTWGAGTGEGRDPAGDLEWEGVLSPGHPAWKVRRGFDVELVAGGLDHPVNLVFATSDDSSSSGPFFYVNELAGSVRVVARDGSVSTYADNAVEFPADRARRFALSDDMGSVGLESVPGTGDLILTGIYLDEESGLLSNHVLRLYSDPGGRRMLRKEVLLDLEEYTTPTHQIQQARVGPDEKLYVSVGDGHAPRLSLHLDRFGGKILRMNLDGTPCEDNPFFDALRPDVPSSYVWASGLRNAFDLDFDPRTGDLYATDNGPDTDRLVRVVAGGAYGWDGSRDSMRTNALFTWGPPRQNTSPTGIVLPVHDPLRTGADRMYVGLFTGRPSHGRSIVELRVDTTTGLLKGPPVPIVQYVGDEQRSVLGLAEGPDGLYFTDFWGAGGDAEATGAVWRLVRSAATEDLASAGDPGSATASPEERGRRVFARDCSACHVVGGLGGGGREGPDLSRVAAVLRRRLHAPAYEALLARLLESEETFQRSQRDAVQAVRDAGDDRVTVWLRQHVREPRFDDKFARMPSFDLPEEDLDGLIAYLLTLDTE